MAKLRRAFVTGVAGFLGSHIADALLLEGYSVAGIDNLSGGEQSNVPEDVEFRVVDCNEPRAYRDMLTDAEVVYHCAAIACEGLSVFSPHLINTHACNATTGVLSAAIAQRAKRFVYCSSMARYGGNTAPYTEEQEPRPVDPYGVSKLAGEMFVRALCTEHGTEFNIAVPHNIIGVRQRYDDPYRNVVAIMINRMLRGLQPIIYGDGRQERCFSFVGDVVPSLVRLGIDAEIRGEVFNVGPDEQVVSIIDLAHQIAAVVGFRLNPIFVPERPMEVKMAYCSSAKARRMLGYRTRYTLHQGLEEMVEWIRAKGPKDFDYEYEIEIATSRTPSTWTDRLI